jgi:hypothetical protein
VGEMVIAAYRPKPGGEEALRALIREHLPALRRCGLVTDRPALLLRGETAYLEIFEGVSREAASKAHETEEVARIWGAMAEVATFPALGELEEAGGRFPHFAVVDEV